jgi:hypothetical protein
LDNLEREEEKKNRKEEMNRDRERQKEEEEGKTIDMMTKNFKSVLTVIWMS